MWRNKAQLLLPLLLVASTQTAQAAPKAVGDVQLATLDNQGISHTIRYADGNWQGFGRIADNPAHYAFSGLTSAVVNGEEHVFYHYLCCGQPYKSWITHLIRHTDGSWNLAGTVPNVLTDSSTARMAVANVNGVLHLVGIDDGGKAQQSSQHADGTWSPWEVVPTMGASPNSFGSLSATGDGSTLRLVLSTSDGTALVEIDQYANGSWSPARQTGFRSDAAATKPVSLSASQVGDDLEVVALGDRAEVYHSIMHRNGSWDLFRNVAGPAGYPGQVVSIAAAASRGELQVAVGTADGGLLHTVRHADGSWQPYGDVEHQAGRPVGVGMVTLAGQ